MSFPVLHLKVGIPGRAPIQIMAGWPGFIFLIKGSTLMAFIAVALNFGTVRQVTG
jgi:hypothetical protein